MQPSAHEHRPHSHFLTRNGSSYHGDEGQAKTTQRRRLAHPSMHWTRTIIISHLQVYQTAFHFQLMANLCWASKHDFIDVMMTGKCCSRSVTITGYDVDDTWREPSLKIKQILFWTLMATIMKEVLRNLTQKCREKWSRYLLFIRKPTVMPARWSQVAGSITVFLNRYC